MGIDSHVYLSQGAVISVYLQLCTSSNNGKPHNLQTLGIQGAFRRVVVFRRVFPSIQSTASVTGEKKSHRLSSTIFLLPEKDNNLATTQIKLKNTYKNSGYPTNVRLNTQCLESIFVYVLGAKKRYGDIFLKKQTFRDWMYNNWKEKYTGWD